MKAKIMIQLIWITFFSMQMFLSVMLLNFLIAIISQSYEEVMSTTLTSQYK
jgi:hypothetical protein